MDSDRVRVDDRRRPFMELDRERKEKREREKDLFEDSFSMKEKEKKKRESNELIRSEEDDKKPEKRRDSLLNVMKTKGLNVYLEKMGSSTRPKQPSQTKVHSPTPVREKSPCSFFPENTPIPAPLSPVVVANSRHTSKTVTAADLRPKLRAVPTPIPTSTTASPTLISATSSISNSIATNERDTSSKDKVNFNLQKDNTVPSGSHIEFRSFSGNHRKQAVIQQKAHSPTNCTPTANANANANTSAEDHSLELVELNDIQEGGRIVIGHNREDRKDRSLSVSLTNSQFGTQSGSAVNSNNITTSWRQSEQCSQGGGGEPTTFVRAPKILTQPKYSERYLLAYHKQPQQEPAAEILANSPEEEEVEVCSDIKPAESAVELEDEAIILEKREAIRQRIAQELLSTEQSYVKGMGVLINNFMKPLEKFFTTQPSSEESEATELVITKDEHRTLFSSSIHVIFSFNFCLLEKLDERIHLNWSSAQKLGDVFLEVKDHLKLYIQYINQYDDAIKVFDELNTRDSFKSKLKELESAPECHGLALISYLILPIQRIPRYVLLLGDLAKNTHVNHPDYEDITSAVQKIREIAELLNHSKLDWERRSNVTTIHGQLDPPIPDLVTPHRRFILEGQLLDYSSKKENLQKELSTRSPGYSKRILGVSIEGNTSTSSTPSPSPLNKKSTSSFILSKKGRKQSLVDVKMPPILEKMFSSPDNSHIQYSSNPTTPTSSRHGTVSTPSVSSLPSLVASSPTGYDGWKPKKKYHFFLFNDLLLLAKKKDEKCYQVKHKLFLCNISLQNIEDTNVVQNAFHINSDKDNLSLLLATESASDKDKFMSTTNLAIEELFKIQKVFSASQEQRSKAKSEKAKKQIEDMYKQQGRSIEEEDINASSLSLLDGTISTGGVAHRIRRFATLQK